MNIRPLSLILLPLMGGTLYAQSTPAPEATPAASEASAHAPLQADPQLISGRLENGLHYLIRPTKEPAGQASMRLYVNTGSLNESEQTKGISHLIEHMVFNGSRHFKRGELIPAMQNLGLGFGGDANAYTGLLQTVYMLDLPHLKPELVDFSLTIMRDFADGATLTDDAIDHERGIIISELKERDSASYRAGIKLLRHLVDGTRVPDYLPIGLEEVIRHCPYETIRQYYRDNYVPERMTFIITGDVAPETARAWIEQHFGSMEKRPAPERPAIGTPADMGAAACIIPNAEAADSTITLSIVNPWEEKQDSLERRVAELPLQLACHMLNRRLTRIARGADSPFLASSAMAQENIYDAAEVFSLSARCRPEQWQAALACAEAELRRAATYGFTENELREAAAGIMANCRQASESWETISADTVAGALIQSLSDKLLFTTPEEDTRAYAAGLARIAARPELCREALQHIYDMKRARLSLAGKVAEGVTAEALSQAYASMREQKVTPMEEEELKPFAYEHVGDDGTVVHQQCHEDVGVTTLSFANGVRVNLKPLDFKKGSVSVIAAVDGGTMRLSSTPALAHMAEAVMNQGGLEAHSADEMNRLFAGNNVNCLFDMDEERFIFSGTTTPDDLELQCKLLCAAIMHPGYREEGEVKLRRALPAFFRRLETNPGAAFATQSAKLLFGDDARFLTPTPEQFAAVNTALVKEALTPCLKEGAMEVTLVGDFRVEDVLPILKRSFGALPRRAPEFTPLDDEARRVNFRPWGQREYLPYSTELDKSVVSHVRPAGNGRDKHRNRRLAVLTDIVKERLFDAIRAELGESYSPSVRCELRKGYADAATLAASSIGVKRNREKVTAAMEIVFNAIGQGCISEDEFQRSLRPYIADADESYRQPWFWANSLTRLQSEPEQLDLLRDFRADVRNITLEEIRDLAREIYGNPEGGNFYFTVPQEAPAAPEAPAPEAPEAEAPAPQASLNAAEPRTYAYIPPVAQATGKKKALKSTELGSPYGIVVLGRLAGKKHAKDARAAVSRLQQKYANAKSIRLEQADEKTIADALRKHGFRYVAFVVAPEDIDRVLVNTLHRATRRVDDDPWGDCLWGIITGATPKDMARVAAARQPLVIKRLLGTTNVGAAPFEHSYCITDWTNAPVLKQSGYKEVQTENFKADEGREDLFAEQLEGKEPQLIVTSSHATQFNLEMPFGKGLIFPANGKFHRLTATQMPRFGAALGAAMKGNTAALDNLAKSLKAPAIRPDKEARVWLAAGNCLFGNAQKSAGSMVVTAMSAYNCQQVVGYTVPSWYGKGGWGTLSLFMGNVDGGSLAEAWFLNNQFILHETQQISPELLKQQFNDEQMSPFFMQKLHPVLRRIRIHPSKAKDAMGLVHDRDVVAFYGDPAWRASIDCSHSPRPLHLEWHGDKSFTLTANGDHKGRAAVWFPNAATGQGAKGCDAPGAVFTNDFILFPNLSLKKGETLTVTIE